MEDLRLELKPHGLDAAEIEASFACLDQTKTVTISYSEFIAAMCSESQFCSESESAFHFFDVSGNGQLCMQELLRMLTDIAEIDTVEGLLSESKLKDFLSCDEFYACL